MEISLSEILLVERSACKHLCIESRVYSVFWSAMPYRRIFSSLKASYLITSLKEIALPSFIKCISSGCSEETNVSLRKSCSILPVTRMKSITSSGRPKASASGPHLVRFSHRQTLDTLGVYICSGQEERIGQFIMTFFSAERL